MYKQKGVRPHHLPEKHFQAINKPEQSYNYTSKLV